MAARSGELVERGHQGQVQCFVHGPSSLAGTSSLALLKNKDKRKKLTLSQVEDCLPVLLALLQHPQSPAVVRDIVLVLKELVSEKEVGKARCRALVQCNGSQVLLTLLAHHREMGLTEPTFLVTLYALLSKLASRDAKFPLKARLLGALKVPLEELKRFKVKLRVRLAALLLLTKVLPNRLNATLLGNEGLVGELLRLVDKRPTLCLQTAHCLDCLAWATRSKRNVLQVVQHGDAQPLLLLLSPGPGCPVPNGNHREKLLVRTLRANLQCLLNIANCKTGRRWLSDGGTPTLLWRWCSTLPEGAPWERLVALACVVIQRCLPPFRLPVASLDGPIAWPPPEWANRAGAHRARDDAVPGDGPGSLMAMDAEESSQSATSSSSEHEADSENEQLDDMQSHAVLSGNETDLDLLEYARFFPELQPQNGCMGVLSEVSKIREGSAESGTVTSWSPDDSLDGQEPAGWQEEQYRRVAQSTQGVVPLVKLAYPELKGHNHRGDLEPLNPDNNMHARAKLLEHVGVQLGMKVVTSRVAYDYDELVTHQLPPERPLGNDDEARAALGRVCVPLRFESRFESGNLRKAIQVGDFEYDLIMSPDVSTNFHHRWFYFEVAGMCEDVDYTFNIINFERSFSLYMEGLCPLLYSVRDACLRGAGWRRVGERICYFRNQYVRRGHEGPFHTLSFCLHFPHRGDVCYLACAFPYTFSLLKAHLHCWMHSHDASSIFFQRQELCKTTSGNPVPVLTLTAKPLEVSRPHVFLSARVHPGETNSSWIMKGLVDFLLSSKPLAQRLRQTYVFKLVPMLNPDGVINGCHRCSLEGQDLNRQWSYPDALMHPTVFHSKALIRYLASVSHTPLLLVDFHGHSRRYNVFLYGCSPSKSWCPQDQLQEDDQIYEAFPTLLHQASPAFVFDQCCFDVERSKESTARVTAWRQLGIQLSYTLECSLSGCDHGMYAGFHLGLTQLQQIGAEFGHALSRLGLSGHGSRVRLDPACSDLVSSCRKAKEKRRTRSSTSSSSTSNHSLVPADDEESVEADCAAEPTSDEMR
ncbi:cytosolic carboxypeptidase 1 isoform X1 [Ixodes scapularis]